MHHKIDLNLLIDFSETADRELRAAITSKLHEGKTKPSDFKILKKLAKGGYGEVYVVEKESRIYAMKKVAKQLVMKNKNATFFMNEKEIMTTHGLDWLVKSYMCLQDETHLFYIMEFVHGGDLLGYLSRKDILKEEEIKFYAAEVFTAIHEMHKAGWIHRDLKPDNILLDRHGHVKLADFGSCVKMENGKVVSSSTVGTPDYISPDVLSSTGETVVYGPEVDYWTVGVILYEMLYGTTPFYSNSLRETYSKIQNVDFQFEEGISDAFRDLISNLICRKETRYGFEQIKNHAFFQGMDWNNLRALDPPFKPHVLNDDDISNFVDTDFSPDTNAAKGGFLNFIGFTHDPDHVSNILTSIVESYNIHYNKSSETDQAVVNSNIRTACGDISEIKGCLSEEEKLSEINKAIQCKANELSDLKDRIGEIQRNKHELSSQLSSLNQSLQGTLDQISVKRAILEQTQAEINMAKQHLQQIKADIVEKLRMASSDRPDKANVVAIVEDLKDIKKSMERFKFAEKLDEVKDAAYWLYKQNKNLENEVVVLSQRENENKSLEDLKRQLRIQKSEIREYEQKIENEIVLRRRLEEEIRLLKKSLKEASRSFNNFALKATNALSNKEIEISIENGVMKVDSREHLISTVFVRELKNNEIHHLPERRRPLSLQMFFLKEPVGCSSSSGSRRSLKALEIDKEKEEKILKGLRDLLAVLEGRSKEEAELQMKGSLKKIEELKTEIERAKRSTIVENRIDDCEKVYEFNSHLFYETTVAKGTLCEHCNEVLYGIVNQAYCCRDCLLVVHKSCYVLVDVSCELNKAIKCGTSIPIICKTAEDKDKLLKLNKVM